MTYTTDEINLWLKENLDNERYQHSLGTAECAKILAEKYNLDGEKAYFTGLIHDCAKCLPQEKMLEIIKKIDLTDGELCNSKTHHAPVGTYIAKNNFKINDEEILSAIRWHTLGKVNMTNFEKIIFLADKIECNTRSCEVYTPIKAALEEENGLDKALLLCYKNTIKSLVDRNLGICAITIDIYNNLIKSVKTEAAKKVEK